MHSLFDQLKSFYIKVMYEIKKYLRSTLNMVTSTVTLQIIIYTYIILHIMFMKYSVILIAFYNLNMLLSLPTKALKPM